MFHRRGILALTAVVVMLGVLGVLVACSGSKSTTTTAPANIVVTISDPPTCASSNSPAGPFVSIFVTVTDVQINASANAGNNDAGWMDLTPQLKNSPQTIDLLSAAASKCFLATLGATTNLPPGTYQQIRIFLASSGSNSSCGSAGPNCVVLTADLKNPRPLLLSSEAQTGLKIPSGQIAGGQFTVSAGQSKTLNIDFDACASIVTLGNGQFRLKPVLHAGEVNTTSNAVDGTLVDSVTGKAIAGSAIVVLEMKDNGIDRKFLQITPDSSGFFSFCPVPAGTYDIVAVVVNSAGTAYATAIITGVGPGSSLGKIPMVASSGGPGSITGLVTTANSTPAGISEDVTLSVLQQAGSSTFTIPLAQQSSTTANVNTQPTSGTLTCPPNTDCMNYTLSVPGVTPTVTAFTMGTAISFTGGNTAPASYMVEGAANCSATAPTPAFSLSPGGSATAATINLTGCT
jgi:uncharacterized protein DUF4382